MKNFSWKKIVPHAIAIGIFLLVAVIYCRPALEGQVLQQNDITHWKGMAQDAFTYKEKHGHYPLWNTHLFSGMPNYQVAMDGHNLVPDFGAILSLWLPRPASFFFLACVCFYILAMTYGVNVFLAVLGALAYAYASYDPLIITVGHETKMMAMAYMPGLLAGLALLYNKRYAWGMIVTSVFAILEIGAGHPQVTYYFLLVAAVMTIYYIVKWIRAGEFKHMVIALGLALAGGLIGIGTSALTLATTYEYTKFTMRGGKTVDVAEANGDAKQIKTTGLDESYAFQYSLRTDETLVLMMPDAFGSMPRSAAPEENSKVVSALVGKGIPEQSAAQLAASLPRYWGGILPFTSGPPYSGALICFLAVIACAVMKRKDKWWIIAATVLLIFISWGSYFSSFNMILFKHLPMFNKFRAHSMALILPQMLLPLLAILGLQELLFNEDAASLKKNFKLVLYSSGGLFALALLVYLFSRYGGGFDDQVMQAYSNPQQGGSPELGQTIVNAMREDHKALFGAGLMHAFWLGAIALAAIYAYMRNWLKPVVIVGILIVVNMVDLFMVDVKFLNTESFQDAQTVQADAFSPTPADQQILQDKDNHYRVLNLVNGDPFNDAVTSYHHRSVGGYHAAKLRIYQDLIESAFSRSESGINMNVLNMLDVRYIEAPGQQQQQGAIVQRNPGALGACWFVKNVQFVDGPAKALNALNNFNPKDTAIVELAQQQVAGAQPVYDSAATIKLVDYDNDAIKYSTSAATPQFAVLSEVYYPAGWNAYIDGKQTSYVNTDYVLRGIAVPAGQHNIEFRFEPGSYYTGQKLVYVVNILFWLSIAVSIFFIWKKQKQAA